MSRSSEAHIEAMERMHIDDLVKQFAIECSRDATLLLKLEKEMRDGQNTLQKSV